MPAKKAAKKAAGKSADSAKPAKKAAKKAAGKAAKKTATAKKAGKTAPANPAISPADVEVSAYLNYRSRLESGYHGDQLGDWLAAENGTQA